MPLLGAESPLPNHKQKVNETKDLYDALSQVQNGFQNNETYRKQPPPKPSKGRF